MPELILPPMHDIAGQLRDGADLDDLCDTYEVAKRTLAQRLRYAGYGISGLSLEADARDAYRLESSCEGQCFTGGPWGGDYDGLPIDGITYNGPRKRRFLGLDWSTSPASGPRWEYV